MMRDGMFLGCADLLVRPGPAHDPARALTIYLNRCGGDPRDSDLSACRTAADMYESGDGTKRDRKRAAELRRNAKQMEQDLRKTSY